jgi:hypothetical protein
MSKWKKTVMSKWYGLPWPGQYEPVSGYTNGLYFIYKSTWSWTVEYIAPGGRLMRVGRQLKSGLSTSDFDTLREAKSAVQRLLDAGMEVIPDNPDRNYLERYTSVLTG